MIGRDALGILEGFLQEIGERYVNTVIDGVDLGFSSIYCSYLSSVGYKGNVLLVDGGNTFNPYFVTRCCRLLSVDERRVLERTRISRAFTCHQLSAILGRLGEMVKRVGSKVVVVTDPTYLYLERLGEERVLGEFVEAFRGLMTTTYRCRLTTLIRHYLRSAPKPCRKKITPLIDSRIRARFPFRFTGAQERVIREISDSVYILEKRDDRIVAVRVKHPFFPGGIAASIPTGPRELTLEEALGAA